MGRWNSQNKPAQFKMKTILTFLLFPLAAFASSPWFLEPTASEVFPLNGGITYHGMQGIVNYRDGYSVGFDVGRYFGPWKLYASYDYTSFQDRGFTLQTPGGPIYQGDHSNYNGQTLMANADYVLPQILFGITPSFGAGVGRAFDGGDNAAFEGRLCLRKCFAGFTLSASFASRFTQGSITSGHVSINEPRQERLTLKLERIF